MLRTERRPMTTPVAILIGAVVIAVAVVIGAKIVARSGADGAAYREGYTMGLDHGEGSDIDQVCDGESVGITIDDLVPTPGDLDDYERGCREGWDDAE